LEGVVEDGNCEEFADLLDRLCGVLGPLRGVYRERSAQALRAVTTNLTKEKIK
jgi:prephenate dehydrogenase